MTSDQGHLTLTVFSRALEWESASYKIANWSPGPHWTYGKIPSQFTWRVRFPHWLPVFVTATIAALSWLPWRFSLRTLLIVTTLVAVVLGLIVYAVRN